MVKKRVLLTAAVFLLTLVFAVPGVSFAQDPAAVPAASAANPKVADAMVMLQAKAAALGTPAIKDGVLYFGATRIDENSTIVDDIKAAKGCTATIFAKQGDNFVRVSTNVMLDGKRAVGTVLDVRGKAYKKIVKGNGYYGVADVVGTKYDAGYEPIKDASGHVIGVYYIGFQIS